MEERKGDTRIYAVWGFFFACIIGGGVFLSLYLILPPTESSLWYPIAGLILVGVPWAFWFLTYLYRCCFRSSMEAQVHEGNFFNKVSSSNNTTNNNNYTAAASPASPPTPPPKAATAATSPTTMKDQEPTSPVNSSDNGGVRHVQFGAVTVMGSDRDVGGGAQIDREAMARQAGILIVDEDEEEEEEEDRRDETQSSIDTTSTVDVLVVSSRESEMPLKLSVSTR